MPARTGKEVIDRLQSHPPNLWLDGQLVEDPTQHPKTRNAVRSLAALYDLQYQDDIVDVMTFESPSSGDRVGRSFVVPENKDDLRRRSEMHKVWADASLGHMGRSPDYMNVNVMAAGMAGDYFEQVDQRFGQNIKHYFEYVRENDLALTHALTNPQVDKSKQANELADPYIALGLVEETSEGILVRGARMLATLPISDEILIFPSTVIQGGEEMRPYALGFSVPNNTPGLRFQCREPLDQGRSHVDHPLGSRFDELDAMVIFDDVIVPWDRVFLIRDVERANQAYARTGAVLHMAHQVVNLKIAKTEAILGTLQSIIDMIGTGHYPHVQEMVAEVIITLEIMKALKLASEEEANVN
ncbi:MAG: 4-hydroxyphenylacetate 3-monooxygenase, oxygenase component, partial [Actinomycetota bacterium]|nr:4-hydroxyphenylacetate 3-monooxygenase, oxygenase component [Actinomycetota bacterium]